MFNNIFFRKSCRSGDNVEQIWYSQTGQRGQYNTAHALCMLKTLGYTHTHTHTHRICNTYWFCMATMVMRTRPNDRLKYVTLMLLRMKNKT